jgi:hypothetical protein
MLVRVHTLACLGHCVKHKESCCCKGLMHACVQVQKMKSVAEQSACGQEFALQAMQASSAEASAAVPFALVFR